MHSEKPQLHRSLFIPVSIGLGALALFLAFRITAAAAFLVFVVLCVCFPLHHNRRWLRITLAVFAAAILIPVDFYIPEFQGDLVHQGQLIHSTHSGPRLVPVLYGLRRVSKDQEEAILGGCMVGIHDVQWRLVWD